MKAIVVGCAYLNVLGLIRSLGESGYEVHLILMPGSLIESAVCQSRYIVKKYVTKQVQDVLIVLKSNYWHEASRIPILCGCDASINFLDGHYDELYSRFLVFNCGANGRIQYFLDKFNTFPVAKAAGLNLIRTFKVTGGEELPKGISYPCLTKGDNSTKSSKADMHICQTEEELKACLRPGVEYLIQDYLEKELEIDVVGLSFDQGKVCCIPAVVRKLRDSLKRQSAYIQLESIHSHPELDVAAIKRLVSKLGYEGIFSVELIKSRGKYYFLEVNLRNDACGYIYTCGGVNYPALWARYCIKQEIPENIDTITATTPIRLIQQRDAKSIIEGHVSVIRWLWQCLTADCYFYYNKKDMMPFLFSEWAWLQDVIKRFVMGRR